MGIAPGFGEEILFRGFLQRGLVSRLGPYRGVLLSAAIFGLAHFLGVVTQFAGCIRTAILCHVLNNTLGILAPGATASVLPTGGAWATALLLALAGASLLYADRQRRSAEKRPPEISG